MSRASTASDAAIRAILETAQVRNRADGITGLLLADGRRYLQAIEGPEAALRDCFARIQADPRHYDIVTVSDAPVAGRQFGDWSMRGRDLHRSGGSDFRHAVMADVADVTDAQLKAMFIGFAALSR